MWRVTDDEVRLIMLLAGQDTLPAAVILPMPMTVLYP